jgi:hypothetical protein
LKEEGIPATLYETPDPNAVEAEAQQMLARTVIFESATFPTRVASENKFDEGTAVKASGLDPEDFTHRKRIQESPMDEK